MEPKIVNLSEKTLVGIIGTASDVSKLDIGALWKRSFKYSDSINNLIEGRSYEIHIQEDLRPTMHFCLVGFEVSKIENLSTELFIKVVPACTYAVFTHSFKDGGFDTAFQLVYDWLKQSEYDSAYHFDIQCYDDRFKSPDDPESIIEIHVPIKSRKQSK